MGWGRCIVSALLIMAAVVPARAGTPDSIDVYSGYGWGRLDNQPEKYRFIPAFINFNYNILEPDQRMLRFSVEPFYAFVRSPDSNFEAGTNFALTVGLLPGNTRVLPYLKAALGAIYISQKTRVQHEGFNFNEYAGAGLMFASASPLSFSVEYRYRHISNARLAVPNGGINSSIILAGVSLNF